MHLLIGALLLFAASTQACAADSKLHALAIEFFAWRSVQEPASHDDVNRVERPHGWIPDWSPQALADYDAKQKQFMQRITALNHRGWTVSDSVDFLLLRSAIARVDYELNVVRSARRNPDFYVQQTLGAVFELLLQPPPFSEARGRNILLRLKSISATLQHARTNLTELVAPFTLHTIQELSEIESQLRTFSGEFAPLVASSRRKEFSAAVMKASNELVAYREWLKKELPNAKTSFAIGKDAYDRYLKMIALIPYTSDEVLRIGQLEWERSVAFDHYEQLRNKDLPPLEIFPSASAQIEKEKSEEEAIRRFLETKGILTVPAWMGHYHNLKLPSYLAPLRWLGVTDDLTSATRLGENSVSYIPDPSPSLSFFRLSTAQDPRPILVHEGIPGHFFQLTLSWKNPDTIRQHYFDSGPVEGIGFYAEEMMLQHGLFDDKPRTREIIYRFMRLRALRVDVDVKLARGDYSIEDAGRYLQSTVPMDEATARQEAADFAAGPGQAITYQIGKTQIVKLLADAKIRQKDAFSLRALHDYIWLNGNVPIALLRWEYLGLRDEISKLF